MTWSSFLNSSAPKILQILAVLAIFFGFYGIAFAAGARVQGKKQNVLALSLFLVPALILAMVGLGIPGLRISWIPNSAVVLGTVALVLTYSAYVAEVIRAGIEGVNPTQRQAARALGLTQSQTLEHVVLPQAFRNVTPPLLNDLVSLQKDSGLISVLGAVDAIRAAGIQTAQSFNFTPYLVAGALFVLLTIPLTRFTDWLTRKQDARQRAQGQW